MKQHELIEHFLVPATLVCLNMAVIHLVYHLSISAAIADLNTYTLLVAVGALFLALYIRKSWLLITSAVFYTFLLFMNFY